MNLRLSIFFSLLFAGMLSANAGELMLNVKMDSENKTADSKSVEKTRAHWLNVRVTHPSGTKLEGLTLK